MLLVILMMTIAVSCDMAAYGSGDDVSNDESQFYHVDRDAPFARDDSDYNTDLDNDGEKDDDRDSAADGDISSDSGDADSSSDYDDTADTAPADNDQHEPFDDEAPDVDTYYPHDTVALRVLASNLTSGNYQAYESPGIRLIRAMNPDIILVQEFNYEDGSIADLVEQMMPGGHYSHGSGQIPNGVVSRWPITDSGCWDDPNISNRDLDWAVVDIPGDRDVFAISVHLHTSPSSDQVAAASVIASEVHDLKDAHPGKYYYVVGGDFNGSSAVSDSGFGNYSGTDIFDVSGSRPEDDNGNPNTNSSRSKPYDWVLAGVDFDGYHVATVFESTEDDDMRTYSDGFVFDTRIYSSSELDEFFPPAETGDSASSQMQHMGVVKDFSVPVPDGGE